MRAPCAWWNEEPQSLNRVPFTHARTECLRKSCCTCHDGVRATRPCQSTLSRCEGGARSAASAASVPPPPPAVAAAASTAVAAAAASSDAPEAEGARANPSSDPCDTNLTWGGGARAHTHVEEQSGASAKARASESLVSCSPVWHHHVTLQVTATVAAKGCARTIGECARRRAALGLKP